LPAGAGLDVLDAVPFLLEVGVAEIGALGPAPAPVAVPAVLVAGNTLLEAVGFETGLIPAPDPG